MRSGLSTDAYSFNNLPGVYVPVRLGKYRNLCVIQGVVVVNNRLYCNLMTGLNYKLDERINARTYLALMSLSWLATVWTEFVPYLASFDYDLMRMGDELAKHPFGWIRGRQLGVLTAAGLGVWRKDFDNELANTPKLWLVIPVVAVSNFVNGLLLYLYLTERRKEQASDEQPD